MAHSTVAAQATVRPLVAASWQRCARAGAGQDAGHLPTLGLEPDALRDYRAGHPLARLVPMFDDLLGCGAGEGHLFAVTDARGTLLWVRGAPRLLRRVERMNFVEGAAWSESAAGTNAPGTALAVGEAVQIRASEHFNAAARAWSCAAAPVRDPDTGRILGVLDLTGGPEIGHPQALALVRATARAAEAELAAHPGARGRLLQPAQAPTAPVLTALGRDSALLRSGDRTLRLRPRHSEILIVLALGVGGMSAGRLAVELAERELARVTLRAEMSRLRAILGPDLLDSQPYRLRRPLDCDFLAVRDLAADGRVADALARYPGPLLPSSQAPAVVAYRDALHQQLRGAVLCCGDRAALRHWVDMPWGSGDGHAWRRLADLLPGGSAPRATAAARAVQLLGNPGLPSVGLLGA